MPRLIAIVAVDQADKVLCQEPGCGHSVYRRIQVVEEQGKILVLGSTCFARRLGKDVVADKSTFGTGDGRKLTSEERLLLVQNTAELIAQFDKERKLELDAENDRRKAWAEAANRQVHRHHTPSCVIRPRPTFANGQSDVTRTPWPWAKPLSSVARFSLKDGTEWVRVQHTSGTQYLMPWPTFDGWDESFPASIGVADQQIGGYRINDVIAAVSQLRSLSYANLVGSWRDVMVSKKTN